MPERNRLLSLFERVLEDPSHPTDELVGRIEAAEPADAAFAFEEFDPKSTSVVFQRIATEVAGLILIELTEERQRELIALTPVARLERIVDSLNPDDAADIYNLLPESHRLGILKSVDKDLASQIRKLSEYEDRTAGGIMTTQFVAVSEADTTYAVIDNVRASEKIETDQVYVVDDKERLRGVLSLQDLLQVEDDRPVADVMVDQVISVHEDDDQEEASRVATTYGLSTLPVVDDGDRLVGIVTADDLDYVQEEEASEDIYRMAGTLSRHPTKLPVSRRILNRIPMILVTIMISLGTSQILSILGAAHRAASVGDLVRAIPYALIVIAVAGNVGNVASAIVVRGLATSELERGRLLQPFLGELLVGLGIALICSCVTLAGIGLLEGSWQPLGVVVAVAILTAVTLSAAGGFVIPLVCDAIGMDPALAGPLVIALNDLVGTALYVATCLLLMRPIP